MNLSKFDFKLHFLLFISSYHLFIIIFLNRKLLDYIGLYYIKLLTHNVSKVSCNIILCNMYTKLLLIKLWTALSLSFYLSSPDLSHFASHTYENVKALKMLAPFLGFFGFSVYTFPSMVTAQSHRALLQRYNGPSVRTYTCTKRTYPRAHTPRLRSDDVVCEEREEDDEDAVTTLCTNVLQLPHARRRLSFLGTT